MAKVATAPPLHVAVLGDVHGHLTLAFRVLRRWERETGHRLDLALQVGDLGAFPPPFRLDSATMRFAARDPDELGFAEYYEGSPEADEVFGHDAPEGRGLRADVVFIKGHHEDFDFLAEQEGHGPPVPVDAYRRIRYLANGMRWSFTRVPHTLSIAALGGIAQEGGPVSRRASPYYSPSELRKLRTHGAVDVLLTHEPPLGAAARIHPKYEGAGSPEVAALVNELRPRFHFCGHYHEPGQALDAPEGTESTILNAVGFSKPHRLNPGCIGILRWAGRGDCRFEVLEAPWLREFTRAGYRAL
jgi:hypothetical protein